MLLTATKRKWGLYEWRDDLKSWAPASTTSEAAQAELKRIAQLPLPESPGRATPPVQPVKKVTIATHDMQ